MDRIIATNLSGKKANEILSGVIGQMSDGMYENSRYYEGFWPFVDIDKGKIIISSDPYHYMCRTYYYNKFREMTDDEVKEFFAKLIKKILQQEARDNDIPVRGFFKSGNNFKTQYLNYYEEITVDNCVKVYNTLVSH